MYRVELSERARQDLLAIRNSEIQRQIVNKLSLLESQPEYGKSLRDELNGYYSLRAARGRYRVIYKIDTEVLLVAIIRIGLRKGRDKDDVYRKLKRELRRGE